MVVFYNNICNHCDYQHITRYIQVSFKILPVQSVPITTKVMSSNPTHGDVYSVQHYLIKFVSDLRQVGGFL
jgi:hypothetical protein